MGSDQPNNGTLSVARTLNKVLFRRKSGFYWRREHAKLRNDWESIRVTLIHRCVVEKPAVGALGISLDSFAGGDSHSMQEVMQAPIMTLCRRRS